MLIRHTLRVLALAALFSGAAHAQSGAVHYREGERVDPQDVVRILGAKTVGKTRSIRMTDDDAASQAAPSLSLPIRFTFDSFEILPNARAQLDALAEGIKLLPEEVPVTVNGHTDGRGSEAYNRMLAQYRADAVKKYLVKVHGIAPDRLKAVGVGKGEPIEGTNPNAAVNRRVQFLGG